ncbi:MAG: WD40 repeat domain-containing protein [Patescibacteria group bacterium]
MPRNPFESPLSQTSHRPEAVLSMRKADLIPYARSYAENLYAQIREIYAKYGVDKAEELYLKMKAGKINVPLEEAERLKELMDKLETVMKTGKTPPEYDNYFYPRQLTGVERKKDYKIIETLEGHTSYVLTLQVLPDGRIVSGSSDNTIIIWDKDDQGRYHESAKLEGHTKFVYTLQVLPDGRIVSGSYDKTIRIWDKDDQGNYHESAKLEGHTSYVSTLQVLPDDRIVSGSADKTIRIWDKDDQGKYHESAKLEGHINFVLTLQVLPDGRIVSGSGDKTIRIWDKDDQGNYRESAKLEGHADWVNALQVLPDGRIVSGSYDKTIRIWDGIKDE